MEAVVVEILAHVAAPARAADDVKYRALAAAYRDFMPARRVSMEEISESRAGQDPTASSVVHAASQRLTQPGHGLESPYLSFRSVDHNLGSPRAMHGEQNHVAAESGSPWRPPPSIVDDSMLNDDFILPEFFTPQRVREHYNSVVDSSPNRSPSLSPCPPPPPQARAARRRGRSGGGRVPAHEDRNVDDSTVVDKNVTVAEEDEPAGNATAAGAAVIIPRSPDVSFKRHRPPETPSFTIIEETRLDITSDISEEPPPPLPPSLPRADTAPLPSKRQRTSRGGPEPSAPLARSATDAWPHKQATAPTSQGYLPPPPPSTPLDDALEIIPPPPPASSRDLRPEDLVTDLLARLARELDLDRRFRPASQSRPLRPFERGYWLLDCRAWEPELKRSAWSFLASYLAKGAAGWGTSCRRDEPFHRLRVYGWGCTVGHIYLVLYLASRRRVLSTGAKWVAGGGEVVVVMPEKAGTGDGGAKGGKMTRQ
ncbi:hypothetical protein VTJ83DRAFT_1995 [Remersonia thermophila]|uniref:Uncharacterized protein n=1 Tax=Remersonia thermophila TaxID=72144 RepID=A0ABR4DJ09_9PEZI